MTMTVRVTGTKELLKALDGDFRSVMKHATLAIAREVHGTISPYPAESEANVEGRHPGWYKRGWGPRWPSNPKRRPKNRKGGKYPITYGADWAGYRISEDLRHSWGVRQKGLGAIVGSRATYAPAVHHWKEQMKKHGQRGWKTDKWSVKQVVDSGAVNRIVHMAVKRKLGGK